MPSKKPETTFIQRIHKHLPPDLHKEKLHNAYRGGMADVWYSGPGRDLWIEYKYIEKLPRSDEIVPNLTPLQRRWLNSRYDEGRHIAVILGTADGGVIYRDKAWITPKSHTELQALMVGHRDIAQWIRCFTGGLE
jgi:hypothetical protein